MTVHVMEPVVMYIDEATAQLWPDAVCKEPPGVLERVIGCEVFFKRDLAFHDFSPMLQR